jgi:hypothetical protein
MAWKSPAAADLAMKCWKQLRSSLILLCQALALFQTLVTAVWAATWYLPISLVSALLRNVLPVCDGSSDGSARFYEVRPSPEVKELGGTARACKPPPPIFNWLGVVTCTGARHAGHCDALSQAAQRAPVQVCCRLTLCITINKVHGRWPSAKPRLHQPCTGCLRSLPLPVQLPGPHGGGRPGQRSQLVEAHQDRQPDGGRGPAAGGDVGWAVGAAA